MNRMIKVGALCGVVALGVGMFIGCKEQRVGRIAMLMLGLKEPR